ECPGFIFIIEGHIKIEKIDLEGRQTSLYEIGQGEICHESLSCHLSCEKLEIIGYALTTTKIGILPKEVMQKYLLEDIEFMKYLYKNLYLKFKLLISHKESIIHQSIEDRLLKYIHGNNKEVIYATHQEIALELGSSREVISRKLKKLEGEGVVELGRGKIKVIKSRELHK
ncbi:MAG: Crp/Fnr family transcriptional regulator, partial [Cellulosilyticaceae bacterium]